MNHKICETIKNLRISRNISQENFASALGVSAQAVSKWENRKAWGAEGIEKSRPLMIELLKYGKQNSNITILEGILGSEEYHSLFETAVKEYGENIFAYYYDLPFEETLKRHSTKPNRNDFGEADMRRWWREKDYLSIISETILNEDLSFDDAVNLLYREVYNSTPKEI